MKGIIIYKGKYGATKQYAEWIAVETNLKVSALEDFDYSKLKNADVLIICSSVYVGKLLIAKWVKKNYHVLVNKKLFFIIVCATPSSEKKKQEKILWDNIPVELVKGNEVNFLPGRLTINKLSWKDAIILRMGSWMIKDPQIKKSMRHDIDGVKREHIADIVNKIKDYNVLTIS